MKKRLMVIVMAVVMALCCVVGLVACNANVDGTYYMYVGGEKMEGVSMVFEDGKVSMKTEAMGLTSTTELGTYEVKGNKVVVTVTVGDKTESDEMEIVSSGVLKVEENGTVMYYCKDGKTPPSDSSED